MAKWHFFSGKNFLYGRNNPNVNLNVNDDENENLNDNDNYDDNDEENLNDNEDEDGSYKRCSFRKRFKRKARK